MRTLSFYAVFFSILFFLLSCGDKQAEITKEMNAGIDLLYRGRYTEAKAHFNKVIELDSSSAEAHLNLGNVYFNQQKYDQAMEEYNRAIHFDPKYGEAYKSRAQLWFVLGERNKSCVDYLKAEKLGVKNLSNYTRHCR